VKVSSGYSTNVSRLISLPDLKVAPDVKSYCYHVLLTQLIAIAIQNILTVNVQEAIMIFFFLINAIGQKELCEEALESLQNRHYETLCFLEMYFPPAFFHINIHFTTHLITEIKLLGSVFLHQMYAYVRFDSILKLFIRNQSYPKGSMIQEYCTEKAFEWTLNYTESINPIGVPKSHHEGRLIGKGTIGKKAITSNPNLFHKTHFHVLQQMSIVSEYLDGHKEVSLRFNPKHNESWLANEHLRKFIRWLRDRISQLDTHISEYLKKLALYSPL
jgi:hypothetical protein